MAEYRYRMKRLMETAAKLAEKRYGKAGEVAVKAAHKVGAAALDKLEERREEKDKPE